MSQPPPTATARSEAVMPIVLQWLLTSGREVLGADLEARTAKGVQTYGAPLMTHNGRDALQDLYEELLDALQYMTQWRAEVLDEEFSQDFFALKVIAMRVKAKLEEKR